MTISLNFTDINSIISVKSDVKVRLCGEDSQTFKIVYTHTTTIPIIKKVVEKDIELLLSIHSASFQEIVFLNKSGVILGHILPTIIVLLGKIFDISEYFLKNRLIVVERSTIRVNLMELSGYAATAIKLNQHLVLNDAFTTREGIVVRVSPK